MTQAIFLSYSSDDADAARRICDALRAAGLEVWFDQSELRGGDAWDHSIRKQIKECTLFVPMISASTQAREEGYFRLEWKLAVDRSHLMADDKTFFLPVVIDDTPEAAARVPDKFRERQWSRLNSEAAITSFAERIGKVLAGSGPPGINAPDTSPVLGFAPAPTMPAKPDDTPSIAVLAFANRSASADDEYFSDGLADELLNVLAKIKGLRVAARTSAFSFKGRQSTIAEIGRALNVTTVLEGSVRKSGNRVRISVQLVKVADGYQLWSETYDRTLDDIFAVQDDIAQAVVTELRATLMGETATAENVVREIELATHSRSEDPEAQRLCLQGRFSAQKRTPHDSARAIKLYEKALEIDPAYATAHAGIGTAYVHAAFYGAVANAPQMLRKAVAAAEAALKLDPTLAEAHLALSWVAWPAGGDLDRHRRELSLARSLAPNDAETWRVHALSHFNLGQSGEARAALTRALSLDPLSVAILINFSMLEYFSGRLDEAEAHLRKALDIDASAWWIYWHLGRVAQMRGQYAEAVEFRAKSRELRGDADAARLSRRAFVEGDWRSYLRTVASEPGLAVSRYEAATMYAELNEIDNAFAMLEQALAEQSQFIAWFKMDPLMAPLRSDPRYPALLKRAGFPE